MTKAVRRFIIGYRGAPSNASGWLENFQGTIFARYANVAGDGETDMLPLLC